MARRRRPALAAYGPGDPTGRARAAEVPPRAGPARRRTADSDDELAATRHRTQLAKVGLGERGPAWWDQTDDERRERWESALAELDALDHGDG